MKFMSWSLNAPSSSAFNRYIQKIDDEWKVVDPNGINTWSDSSRNMFYMFESFNKKISDFGLHEFGVRENGDIYDYRATSINVLDNSHTKIRSWIPTSLQYLIEKHTHVNYSIQTINFGQKVDKFLHINRSGSIPNFINQLKIIAQIYKERWPSVNTIELDFEKTYTLKKGDPIYDDRDKSDRQIIGYAYDDDWNVYSNFIKRVKDDVCIPLGMKLRVNMYAMTGDFNPHYYAWHDYRTLASKRDKNGNQAIDEFQLMTYDFTYAYSSPGPSTPLWWLKDVLEHVKDSLTTEKTWIGNAGYGRRWGLDNQQSGRTVTYHQLLMWQNGMYVHNHGEEDKGKWIWHEQDWLPFASFNDRESGYQITYPHLYDKFDVTKAHIKKGNVNRLKYGSDDLITSYFKSQQPIFKGVKAVANNLSLSGNISGLYTQNGITKTINGKSYQFKGSYRANRALYIYDENIDACVRSPDKQGKDGKINIDINIDSSGRYKLIALVHFNTYQNNEIKGSLNGRNITIGGSNIEDWWPFYVNQSAWIEVGTFDFNTSNNIELNVSSGYIWGFVVCEDFEQNFEGGTVEFNSYLAPFYKRDSEGKPIKASMPSNMTLTAEILRRPPRPAIIFEDNFIHLLNNEKEGFEVSSIPYYMKTQDHYEHGTKKVYDSSTKRYVCTTSDGIYKVGFSSGSWKLQKDGRVRTNANQGNSNQLILHRKFRSNVQVRADLEIHNNGKAGIRLLADEEGNSDKGYLALLDFSTNRVVFAYQSSKSNIREIASISMSESLKALHGKTISICATIYNNKAYINVGKVNYLNGVDLPYSVSSGAHGVYVSNGTVYLSMFNISTVDRYEPLEKLKVEIDGKVYKYGEVPRKVGYDNYGYLKYSGLDVSTTELEKENWEEDYRNIPLARHNSWNGRKLIRVQMVDAGIWFKNFFIGDSEGYSVAYNSDFLGFVETTKLLYQYRCKGVAMWTLGQEDPQIFNYLPSVE